MTRLEVQTADRVETRPGSVTYALYLGLVLLVLAMIGLGYFGFRHFATTVMPQMGAFNLLALAVIAGVASFFSPCAFPLLPSYLSFYVTARGDRVQSAPTAHAWVLGLAAAANPRTRSEEHTSELQSR